MSFRLFVKAAVVVVGVVMLVNVATRLVLGPDDSGSSDDPVGWVVGIGSHREPSRPAPALGAAGLPRDGVTVLDDDTPSVANLDADLLDALRRAAADAADEGVDLHVNSGWRSAEHQARLLRDAVAEYGSEEEAARWVAAPETSVHVSGDAVDIGPSMASAWLSDHGSAYGLCQIYLNEPWHYELRPDATAHGCPRMYADPTDDPRMQR